MEENKKSSIIAILKILMEYSDLNHPLTQAKIIELVNNDYGIEIERKAVSRSINLLIDMGYDINQIPKKGYYYLHDLTESEVTLLSDMIYSYRSITSSQAKELINHVQNVNLSKDQRRNNINLYKTYDVSRTLNKNIFYNIDLINEAILKNCRIDFKYLGYDKDGKLSPRMNGYIYKVNPYFLVNISGKYYLLGQRRYPSLTPFKLDLITDIVIREDRIRPPLSNFVDNKFSIDKYLNEHIYMFEGKTIEACLILDKTDSIVYIKERFGELGKIKIDGDEIQVRIKCNEDALYYWCMQYNEHIKVVSPESLINRIKESANKMLEKYKNSEENI